MPARPNILLITSDQQRWDAMGCAGNPVAQTPNMDRLAGEGVHFRQAISNCPVCVPARLTLVSGLMSGRLGCISNSGPTARPDTTLPATLAAAGYRTQAIGKMHFKPSSESYGFQGMLLSEEMRWVRQPALHTDGKLRLDDYDRYLHERGLWGWEKPPEIGYNEIKPVRNPLPIEHHVTTWCGDRAVEFLGSAGRAPFFLWLSFTKPHVPYDAPRGMEELYDPARLPPPLRRDGDLDGKHPGLPAWIRKHEFHLYSEEAKRQARAWYLANVTLIDRQIGRVIDALRVGGEWENTVILFTSDHGDLQGDHEQWFKTLGYEGSLRVPFILRLPGGAGHGRPSDAHASLVDVVPTLLAAAGCAAPEALPGHDLAAVLDGRAPDAPFAAAEIHGLGGAMQYLRTRELKYIHAENGGFEELYDLARDPGEFTNLALQPGGRDRCRPFRAQLAACLARHSRPELSLADGDLRDKPLASLSDDPGPRPFSRMPWEVRVPPACLPDLSGKLGWWAHRKTRDFTSLFGKEEWA
jgi:arylsulfatase A-like enzyme